MKDIDKSIEIPEPYKQTKYPWADMGIGDSFFTNSIKLISMVPHAHKTGQRLGKKFVCRKVENGVRVWRVE